MNVASGRTPPPSRPVRARARLRPKSQITLPEEIRLALHVSVGDELEFAIQDDGTITVQGYVSIPSDQLWRYTPRQDEGLDGDDEPPTGRAHPQ
jgi:bifunctional DNA-binding transcriptional regulator/antitoxin component of YhaV-PrlF toxin-antitoxin module